MNRLILFRTLRPAGGWLIVLMCLTLTLPAVWLATPSVDGAAKQLELIAQSFAAELLNSPVVPPGNSKHSTQGPETETISSNLALTDQLSPCGAGYLQIVTTSTWLIRFHQLSLPRPPPLC